MSRQGGETPSSSTSGQAKPETKNRNPDSAPNNDGADSSPNGEGGSGLWTRIAVVLVAILLLSALAGANVTGAAERTVLDVDHVIETMDEEGLFADETDNIRDEVAKEITDGTAELDLPPGIVLTDFDPDRIAEESVSEPHVREQMVGNLQDFYAFLHGDQEDLQFDFNLVPVKDGISAGVTDSATVDTATLVGDTSEDIDRERVAALEDEEHFEDAQMERHDQQVESMKERIEADVQARGYTPELTEALTELQFTVVDGLAGELSFETYNEQREANEETLKVALGTEAVADMDDSMVHVGEDEDAGDAFGEMAAIVQLISTLALALPLLALGLVASIGVITRSVQRTAMTTGGALLGAGLLGLVVGYVVPETVLPDSGGSDLFGDGFMLALDSMFATIGTQSVLLAAGGLVLIGLVLGERRSLFDGFKQEASTDSESVPQPATEESHAPDQGDDSTADQESDRRAGE